MGSGMADGADERVGEDLAALLHRSGPLEPARAVDIVSQVARALDAAHATGRMHGDVTPATIRLAPRPDGGDLAGATLGTDDVQLVDGGTGRTADASAGDDVHALARVLVETLTGQRPGVAGEAGDPVTTEPPGAVPVGPDIPDLLAAVAARGMAPDPADRWTSAGGMAAAARAALGVSGIEVPRPGWLPAPAPLAVSSGAGVGRFGRGGPAAAAAAAALVAIGLAVWRSRRGPRPRP